MTIEDQLLEATAALSGLTAERDDLRATVEKLTVGAAAELEALKVSASEKDAKIAELSAIVEAAASEDLRSKLLKDGTIPVAGTPELAALVADVSKAKYTYAFTDGQMCSAAAVRIGCGPISISTEQPSAATVRTLSVNCTG